MRKQVQERVILRLGQPRCYNPGMGTYTVILSPETGGYSVFCPAMPGAVSQGETRAEALANIAEAMEGWLAVEREFGGDALPETPELVAAKIAQVLGWRAEEGWDLTIETVPVLVIVNAVAA